MPVIQPAVSDWNFTPSSTAPVSPLAVVPGVVEPGQEIVAGGAVAADAQRNAVASGGVRGQCALCYLSTIDVDGHHVTGGRVRRRQMVPGIGAEIGQVVGERGIGPASALADV